MQVDQLFGVSKTDTDKLWAGISNASTSEGSLKTTDDYQPLKPLLSVISEKTLSCSMSVNSYTNRYVRFLMLELVSAFIIAIGS